MAQWTTAQVDSLAPDAKSIKAAQKLLSIRRWPLVGANDAAIWGQCQGSGSKPYSTRVDLANMAFKCSCPSRKFPCKHGLALLYLYAQQPSAFTETTAPEWVTEWLAARSERQKKKTTVAKTKPVDTVAQAKRIDAREAKISAGLTELERWLHDLMRAGLADLSRQPQTLYADMAARLMDAQAPGLAKQVHALAALRPTAADWASQLLQQLGDLQLLIAAYRRQDQLPPLVKADVRRAIGWPEATQALQAAPGVTDTWLVLALQVTTDDRLRTRKAWLWGQQTGRVAMFLEQAFGTLGVFQTQLGAGQKWQGELAFYPSQYPQRAIIKSKSAPQPITPADLLTLPCYSDFNEMLNGYSQALAANCWVPSLPVVVQGLTPVFTDGGFNLRDAHNNIVPIAPSFEQSWSLMAVSGGAPIRLIAEWTGAHLLPLAVWDDALITFTLED